MLQQESSKYLIHRDFVEQGDTENLQDFAETSLDFQFLLEDGHEQVNADGNPDLGLDGVGGGSIEGLGPKVLFDPIEEQLHPTAALVQVGNGQGRKGEVVGQKDQALPVAATQAGGLVDVAVSTPAVNQIASGANQEEGQTPGEGVETPEVDVATIHDVEGAGLEKQLVEDIDIVHVGGCDADKTRDAAAQVHQGVDFDGSLASSKSRPGEQRKTQIDGGRIQGVGTLLQGQAEVLFRIQPSGPANEHLGEVGPDAPVSGLVGIGQGASGDSATDAGMIELRLDGAQTSFGVAQTFPIGELCEDHAKELIQAGKLAHPVVASIATNTPVELVPGQEIHQLGEHQLSRVHQPLLSSLWTWRKYG